MTPLPVDGADPIGHYENFPVASWLCPPHLREPITAIYAFARTADDMADEGNATPKQRLLDLSVYREELDGCFDGRPPARRWSRVFRRLQRAVRLYHLPPQPFFDLLDAFEQDVRKTRDGEGYASRAELVDYCARSANPIGRLVLHLYEIDDAQSLAQSDAVCTALQLTNFWQDLSVDVPRGRFYVPAEDCARHGLDPVSPASWPSHPNGSAFVADLVAWARETMLHGAPIAKAVRGRGGWELRLVVQGGLRILEKIDRNGGDAFAARPRLTRRDAPVLAWRALRM